MKNFNLDFTSISPNIMNPENEIAFKYLSQFLNYKPLNLIYSKEKIESLINNENKFHQIIKNPSNYNLNKLSAWKMYISFIKDLIPKEYHDNLRIFLVLEYFTQAMYQEKEFYLEHDYISYWIFYADFCRDDLDILKVLLKKNICTNNAELYIALSYIYEKYHAFTYANDCFLQGFNAQCKSDDYLKKNYEEFEIRMENRINREINSTNIKCEDIDKYVHNEIYKFNNDKNNLLYNENKNDLREKGIKVITMNFKIYNNKLEILDDNINYQNEVIQYGNFPIYIDETCRKNISRKGTQLVELYKLIVDFLNNNDVEFKVNSEKFKNEIIEYRKKKPYSWLSLKRPYGNQNFDLSNSNLSFFENNNEKNTSNQDINQVSKNNNCENQFNINNINNNLNDFNANSINQMVSNELNEEINKNNINNIKNLNDCNNNFNNNPLSNLKSKELDDLILNELNLINEHKKRIEELKQMISDELNYVKKKEENLKLIEEEYNSKKINYNNNNILDIHRNLESNNGGVLDINKNLESNNNNILDINRNLESNNKNNSSFTNYLINFLSNDKITIDEIKNKNKEIEYYYKLNKITLSDKLYYINLLNQKYNQIIQNHNKIHSFVQPNFKQIKPLESNENINNNLNFNQYNNKNNINLVSHQMNNNNNLNQGLNYQNNNNSTKFLPININDFDLKNNTPTINKFFESENKMQNKMNDENRFEKLFLGKDDYEKEIIKDQSNFKRYNLNDNFDNITNTNHFSSITEKTFESRKTSIEHLFNS